MQTSLPFPTVTVCPLTPIKRLSPEGAWDGGCTAKPIRESGAFRSRDVLQEECRWALSDLFPPSVRSSGPNGKVLKMADVTRVWDETYGTCFQYKTNETQLTPGSSNGAVLHLDIHPEYYTTSAQGNGLAPRGLDGGRGGVRANRAMI